MKIGLFGFGCVGQGVYEILSQSHPSAEIKKIAIKHPEKSRIIDISNFTTDHDELLDDPEIDIIVEVIDDSKAAFDIVQKAVKNGKKVVTANKKMVAERYEELYQLQQEYNTPVLYEAATCASIPVIRSLEDYYADAAIEGIEGIHNGTTNYILTRLFMAGGTYNEILEDAKALGFTESDASLDVNGSDAMYKMCINIAHAFGIYIHPSKLTTYGIETIQRTDIDFAKRSGQKIRLLAKAVNQNGNVSCWVMPALVDSNDLLYNVDNEQNCVKLIPTYANDQFQVGNGAGSYPTGSAVVSDICSIAKGYSYPYSKRKEKVVHTDDVDIAVYIRYVNESQIETVPFSSIYQKSELNHSKFITGILPLRLLKDHPIMSDKNAFIVEI